jgi:hypothetical protein
MNAEELYCLDPDEIHFKIEENFRRVKIGAIRSNTIIMCLKSGIPAKFAQKLSLDEKLSKDEINELGTALKKNKR